MADDVDLILDHLNDLHKDLNVLESRVIVIMEHLGLHDAAKRLTDERYCETLKDIEARRHRGTG